MTDFRRNYDPPIRNPSNSAFAILQSPATNKLSCDPPPITDSFVYLATLSVGNSVRARKSTKPMISIHFGPPRTRCPGTRESTPWGRLSPPPPTQLPRSHNLCYTVTPCLDSRKLIFKCKRGLSPTRKLLTARAPDK